MPKLPPPLRTFDIGDVVTVGNGSKPLRIVGKSTDGSVMFHDGTTAAESECLRYHGTQRP